MTLLFLILAILHLVQIGLAWLYAAGHHWALPALAIIMGALFIIDVALAVASIVVKRQIDKEDNYG